MSDIPDAFLITALVLLIFASAFFSGSETGMVAINRYRLRHLARNGHRGAQRVERLLARMDRLLGVILIGNNFVNNYAATIAALLALAWFGNTGAALAPIVFTIVMLIFAEVTPKTYAARRPEGLAFFASLILRPLQVLFAPLLWAVGGISNGILSLFGTRAADDGTDDLSPEELRTVVNEAGGLIPKRHQKMLLNILDLEKVTVEDIMIPRSEMVGIDIDSDITDIISILRNSQHTRLPIYRSDPNDMVGVLHLRKVNRLLMQPEVKKAELMQFSVEPYYVPEGTPLHRQLINFQNVRRRMGIVVDEYGDVLGLITLEDILEEIVGEFTTDLAASSPDILPQEDGSYVIDGSAHLREINRTLQWDLPTDGPKTLNGLILEYLQDIPDSSTSLRVDDYLIEILQVKDNMVKATRVRRRNTSR
ncbi:HlyC/CorC family transporter [Alcanivorax sp. JB21]|uniref:HlyC/CorC family transporter n=1 Tax=Alcanivorax limicola TaxID=2874102 RepID=UPI001CBDBB18|nr:HlyC/CorC family transporter [Alcanivorax limicola]MBZ2189561.1 HlyC/CorC family transporter [Alcanivorax limicola]